VNPSEPHFLKKLSAIAELRCATSGPAHDFLHVRRVVDTARRIAEAEGADHAVVVPAALLHELFNHPKGHPESHLSGEVCAEHARVVLVAEGCAQDLVEPICEAIRVHPFSRGILPGTIEGRVLQDADRLDAIGAIGIARCFATCAEMGRPLYASDDPFCRTRLPDDKSWGLDHFYKKLLLIPEQLHTKTARAMADSRVETMRAFLASLQNELGLGR
jgi:uncharacterized protein